MKKLNGKSEAKRIADTLCEEEYETQMMRVVFKDSSFKDVVVKTNAIQVPKEYGIDEVVSV